MKMTSLLTKVVATTCKVRLTNCGYLWHIQKSGAAKKAAKAAAPAKKKELEVEENTELLVSRLCGGNIYKEGEDPVLKPDSEYPDWLWTLRLERAPLPLEAYSKDDPKYWKKLKKWNIKRNNYLRRFIKRF